MHKFRRIKYFNYFFHLSSGAIYQDFFNIFKIQISHYKWDCLNSGAIMVWTSIPKGAKPLKNSTTYFFIKLFLLLFFHFCQKHFGSITKKSLFMRGEYFFTIVIIRVFCTWKNKNICINTRCQHCEKRTDNVIGIQNLLKIDKDL